MPFFPTAAAAELRTLADVDQSTAPGDGESPAWSAAADRFAWSAGGGGAPPATVVVAAANSLGPDAANADFVCDGTADQVEINAALAIAGDEQGFGGQVLLLDGRFNISDGIRSIGAPVHVRGMGWHEFRMTIIRRVADFGGAAGIITPAGSQFSDFFYDGDFRAGRALSIGHGTKVHRVHVYGATVGLEVDSRSVIRDCVLEECDIGIIQLGEASRIHDCDFRSIQAEGIQISGGGNFVTFNRIRGSAGLVGIQLSSGTWDNIVIGNDLRTVTTPINDEGLDNILTYPGHATFGDNFT